jgi:GGDEF domain-containing protein
VDTVARYAGDQFLLLAPGPDGLIVTERLVRGISALAPVDGKSITVSAGIAGFPLDGRTTEELIEVAERAMQSAHEAGGARVVGRTPPAN